MLQFKPFSFPYEHLQISKPLGHSLTLKAGETLKAEVIDVLPSGGIVLRAKGAHITVQTEIPLKKDTQLLLKVLDTKDSVNKIKLQIISVIDKNQIYISPKGLENISSLLLQFPELKEAFSDFIFNNLPLLENLSKEKKAFLFNIIKSLAENISINTLKDKSFLIYIKNLTPENLQKALLSTGVLFETKIKKEETTSEDLKFKILKENKEDSIQILINQHQTLSVLGNGFSTFLPVLWEDLKRGDIFFQKKNQKHFFCRIDLDFVSVGKITVDIFMLNKDLMINFFVESKKFREVLSTNLRELEEKLNRDFNYVFITFKDKETNITDLIFSEKLLDLKA